MFLNDNFFKTDKPYREKILEHFFLQKLNIHNAKV